MKRALRERLTRNVNLAARSLLPEAVVQELRLFRAYENKERPIYLRLRISDGLGFTNPKLRRAPPTARRFLFVCFGNIIRSPMCEALMKRELARLGDPEFAVTSAGLNATAGRAPHPWALAAAREFGISLEHHHAQPLTREIVDRADAIFAMDYQNRVQLLSRWASAKDKIFMLTAYSSQDYRSVEIPDPYYLGEEQTRRCYEILNSCIQTLVCSLSG